MIHDTYPTQGNKNNNDHIFIRIHDVIANIIFEKK